MAKRKSADTPAVRRLGREISRLRKLADMSQEHLGRECGMSSGMIGHIERAERSPTKRFVAKADEVLGAQGHLLGLWPDVVKSSYPEYVGDVLDAIPRSTIMRDYHPTMVPGLLQTDRYAEAALRAGNPFAADEQIARLLEGRAKLRQMLTNSDTPVVWEIVDEMAIRRLIGDSDVLAGQIDRLSELSGSGRIRLQIIPGSVRFRHHPGLDGPFAILSFAGEQDVAYVEGVTAGQLVTKPDTVERLSLKFGSLQGAALSTEQTTELLRRMRGEIDGRQDSHLEQIQLQQ